MRSLLMHKKQLKSRADSLFSQIKQQISIFEDLVVQDLVNHKEHSNFGIILGKHTAKGLGSMFEDNTHMNFENPGIWMQKHVVSAESGLDIRGFAPLGAPGGMLVGCNNKICWFITNAYGDSEDAYIVEPSTATTANYTMDGQEMAYSYRSAPIYTRDFATGALNVIPFVVKETVFGPVVNHLYGLNVPGVKDIVLRALYTKQPAGSSEDRKTSWFDGMANVYTANNFDQFRAAVRPIHGVSLNLGYIDIHNNGGYCYFGGAIHRAAGHSGIFPVPLSRKYDWSFFEDEEKPCVFNPKEGFIQAANSRVTPRGYPNPVGHDFANHYRAQRARDNLQTLVRRGNVVLKDMKAHQFDTLSLMF
jgi:penicillin amidase